MATNGNPPSPRIRRTVLVVAAAVVAATGLAVGLILALGGHGTTPLAVPTSPPAPTIGTPSATASPTPTQNVPAFDLRVLKVTPVRGSSRTRVKVVREVTRRAVKNIRDELGRMYRLAFLVPADWQHDRYGPVFQLFAGEARASARKHTRLLTLGPGAGKQFERVVSASGTLKIKVLLDRGGHPFTAAATADFRAHAARTGGGTTLIHSQATFFLRPSRHGWLIDGFEVHRKDKPRT